MNVDYYNKKWIDVISKLPIGGNYRFDLRQNCYNIIKDYIKKDSKVFDYACGLGRINIQLAKEKGCKVSGCDISDVAVNYVNKKLNVDTFNVSNIITGKDYDYILAIYFLEHISDPVQWVNSALKVGKKVIVVIPNDFNRHGEHINMKWSNWESFNDLFKDFKLKRLDDIEGINKYPYNLSKAFKHPIFEIT